MPEIIEDNLASVTYTLDGNLIQVNTTGLDVSTLNDGKHSLTINAVDKFGLTNSETFDFIVDSKSPTFKLESKNNTIVSKRLDIQVSVSDENLPKSNYLSYLLPNGERIVDEKSYSFDVSDLDEGEYSIDISIQDMAKNNALSKIMFEIDHSVTDPPKSSLSTISPENVQSDENYLLIIIISIIAVAIVSVLVILKQKSKTPQKN